MGFRQTRETYWYDKRKKKNNENKTKQNSLRYEKTGNKKRATCFATLLQNELNSDVARFATHSKPFFQQIRLLTGLNIGSKTRNINSFCSNVHCCKTSCTFFVARFFVPLGHGKTKAQLPQIQIFTKIWTPVCLFVRLLLSVQDLFSTDLPRL